MVERNTQGLQSLPLIFLIQRWRLCFVLSFCLLKHDRSEFRRKKNVKERWEIAWGRRRYRSFSLLISTLPLILSILFLKHDREMKDKRWDREMRDWDYRRKNKRPVWVCHRRHLPRTPLPSAAEFEPNDTQNNNPSPLKDNDGEIHSRHQPMFSIRVSICFSFRVCIGAFAIRVLICFRFSVLIGAFAIRVRFVTLFVYLELSQRSSSDNNYNEMVVVVYGEKTYISVWSAWILFGLFSFVKNRWRLAGPK